MAGTVREDSTGRPLAGVEVLIGNRRAVSDGRGRYVLDNVANGEHVAEPSYLALWTRRKP